MSGTLALASAIAEMNRDELRELLLRRPPGSPASISDPIGLAVELLRTESISRALAGQHRDALTALLRLAAGGSAAETADLGGGSPSITSLVALGLAGLENGAPIALPEVTAVLEQQLAAAGVDLSGDDAVSRPGVTGAAPTHDSAAWFGTALTFVAQLAECLRAIEHTPVKLNRNGSTAVSAVRALSESTHVDTNALSRALICARESGLIEPDPDAATLIRTPAATLWLTLRHTTRWLDVAAATLRTMPAELVSALQREHGADLAGAARDLSSAYPLLPPAKFDAALAYADRAEHLGLTVGGQLTDVAQALRADDRDTAATRVASVFPDAAPHIYLQPDLSVVIAGPLPPSDEAQLAALTVPEQVGIASTRRITEASLARSLDSGGSPADARGVLERLSLTEVPQPLEYLLSTLAERYGSIVVEEMRGDETYGDDGRTRIVTARPDIAEMLLVDRSLQHLRLQRVEPTVLVTRLRTGHVMTALTDARHHAILGMSGADQPGETPAPPTGPVSTDIPGTGANTAAVVEPDGAIGDPPAKSDAAPDPLTELAERVYLAARNEPGTGDFVRRLELAMRDRLAVRVTAEARGQAHAFTLLPLSLNAGRLRANDTVAGVERTLPVNIITAVEPA